MSRRVLFICRGKHVKLTLIHLVRRRAVDMSICFASFCFAYLWGALDTNCPSECPTLSPSPRYRFQYHSSFRSHVNLQDRLASLFLEQVTQ